MLRMTVAIPRFVLLGILVVSVAAPGSSAAGVASVYERVNKTADAYLHYSLARLMETSGLLSEALVQYRRTRGLDPGHCEVDTAIARVLLAMGRVEEARELAETALARCEGNEAIALAGAAMMAAGDAASAEDVLREPAEAGEGPMEIVGLLGQALMAQGRLDEALELWRRSAESDSLDPRASYLYARALLAFDRPEDAASELRRANRLDPDNQVVRFMLGRLLLALGDAPGAVTVLEPFVTAAGAREAEHLALARAHALLGNLDRARNVVESALEKYGETAELLTMLGSIQFDGGEIDGALASYERVLELAPDSVQALNFVAYTLADLELDAERSVTLAERAAELAPNSGLVRDTLGWAYFRAGRFAEAVAEIEHAIGLGENDPVIHEHLGDALEALGRSADAIEAWRRALELEPGRTSSAARIEAALLGLESGSRPADGREE